VAGYQQRVDQGDAKHVHLEEKIAELHRAVEILQSNKAAVGQTLGRMEIQLSTQQELSDVSNASLLIWELSINK
jgi:hypothetical protein